MPQGWWCRSVSQDWRQIVDAFADYPVLRNWRPGLRQTRAILEYSEGLQVLLEASWAFLELTRSRWILPFIASSQQATVTFTSWRFVVISTNLTSVWPKRLTSQIRRRQWATALPAQHFEAGGWAVLQNNCADG